MQAKSKPPVLLTRAVFEKNENTRVYWLGGGSFLICSRGDTVLIDPQQAVEKDGEFYGENELRCFYRPALDLTLVPAGALALYTHSDADHFGPAASKMLDENGLITAGPIPVYEQAVDAGFDTKRLKLLRIGDVYTHGSVKITAFIADHPWQMLDTEKFGRPFVTGECLGYIIETPDARMFFAGDTRLVAEHMTLENIDLLGLDASTCAFHLAPMGAATLANRLKEAKLVPCHYGTYDAEGDPAHGGDPKDVLKFIKSWEGRYIDAAPGEEITF